MPGKRARPTVTPIAQAEEPTPLHEQPKNWTTDSGCIQIPDGAYIGRDGVNAIPATAAAEQPEQSFAPPQHDFSPDDLEQIKVLGKGASGEVWLVQHRARGKQYAVKQVSLNDVRDMKMVKQEMSQLDSHSPFVVKAFSAYVREKRLFIVQELMDKGSLLDVLRCYKKPLPELAIAKCAEQVVRALLHLHTGSTRRMHRDLKPANILINSAGHCKVADFGIATEAATIGVETFVGTPIYMSPERIQGKRYGFPSDIWSLGLLVCECALGRYPFAADLGNQSFLKLLMEITGDKVIDFPPDLSSECKDFVMCCLKQEPNERWTAVQLVQHPFIKRYESVSRQKVAAWLKTFEITPETDASDRIKQTTDLAA